jgi:hypothetical protein
MNWFSSSRGQAGSDSCSVSQGHAIQKERIETIRAAMLEALAGTDAPGARVLMLRIHCAGDAVGLWYMRPEVMSMLASRHGEATARRTLARLGIHFQGILPEGLSRRLEFTKETP